MKTISIYSIVLLLLIAPSVYSQDNKNLPQRTPEQEAVKQTDRFQQELNLTSEQARQIYDINLRYARERQISNKRSEAIERMKNKNAEIQQILSPEQYEKLKTKRYERTTIEFSVRSRIQTINSSGFHSTSDFRTNYNLRIHSPEMNMKVRKDTRVTTPSNQSGRPLQSVHRNVNSQQQNQHTGISSFSRSTYTPPINTTQRPETPLSPARK
jgi:hypothetical protein